VQVSDLLSDPDNNATAINTGTGTATNLLARKASLMAGQSATMTFTARVRYASPGAVATAAQNSSVYASTEST